MLSQLHRYDPPKWATSLKNIPQHFVQVRSLKVYDFCCWERNRADHKPLTLCSLLLELKSREIVGGRYTCMREVVIVMETNIQEF